MSHPLPVPLAIYGASGHGKVIADAVARGGVYRLAGFIDDNQALHGGTFASAAVLGGLDAPDALAGVGASHVIVGVGDCRTRLMLARRIAGRGLKLATVIHPSAVLAAGVVCGEGTFVAAGAIVNADASIGDNVILNTGCTVDHDCTVGAGAHISPGAHLAGNVSVGEGTWIGIGACVKEGVRIGRGVVIGAGAVVVRDIPDGAVAYGVPARVVRYSEIDA